MMHDHTAFAPGAAPADLILPRLRDPAGAGPLACPAAFPPSFPAAGHATFSPSLLAMLDLRRAQVERHGHTAASDDALDLHDFSKAAGRHLRSMNEYASLHHVEGTRTCALRLAAFALALAESCDRRLSQGALHD